MVSRKKEVSTPIHAVIATKKITTKRHAHLKDALGCRKIMNIKKHKKKLMIMRLVIMRQMIVIYVIMRQIY